MLREAEHCWKGFLSVCVCVCVCVRVRAYSYLCDYLNTTLERCRSYKTVIYESDESKSIHVDKHLKQCTHYMINSLILCLISLFDQKLTKSTFLTSCQIILCLGLC